MSDLFPLATGETIFTNPRQLNMPDQMPNPYLYSVGPQSQGLAAREQAFSTHQFVPLSQFGRFSVPGTKPLTTPAQSGISTAAGGLQAGLSVSPQGTGIGEASFDVLGAVASGALSGGIMGSSVGGIGAVPGAIIGGGVGLIVGAGKAFFSVSNNRKRARALREAARRAEEAQRVAIAREVEWRNRTRLDGLRTAEFNRTQAITQNGWVNFQNRLAQMTNMINNNAQSRQAFLNMLQPVRA